MAVEFQPPVDGDDDDWTEFERPRTPGPLLPAAQVRLSKGEKKTATGYLAFRRDLAEWCEKNGPRFRIFFGGRNDERLMIRPDLGGRFEVTMFKGTARIALGPVNVWPNEHRDPVEAEADIGDGRFLVLTVPLDFTRPSKSAPPAAVAAAKPAPSTPAIPITTKADGLIGRVASKPPPSSGPRVAAPRITDHRVHGAVSLGDPAPGRSALDQRKKGG